MVGLVHRGHVKKPKENKTEKPKPRAIAEFSCLKAADGECWHVRWPLRWFIQSRARRSPSHKFGSDETP